jgi:sporulation protein YlmC with PRC-barrel domain
MAIFKEWTISREETVMAQDVAGQKVIDNSGKNIGTIRSIHFDPKTLMIQGVTIDNGLFKGKDYVGVNYISSLTQEGAVLNTIPLTQYIGMEVFDSEGKRVGTVKEVSRVKKTNNLLSLTIDRGIMMEDKIVTYSAVKEVGKNIVLKKKLED